MNLTEFVGQKFTERNELCDFSGTAHGQQIRVKAEYDKKCHEQVHRYFDLYIVLIF